MEEACVPVNEGTVNYVVIGWQYVENDDIFKIFDTDSIPLLSKMSRQWT